MSASRLRQAGFTIIELIVVIVILGILAATALPKFIDLGTDAKQAAVAGVAGAATSAYSLNYSGCAVKGHVPTADKCVQVSDCSNAAALLQGGMPAGYAIAASGAASSPAVNGSTFECSANLSTPETGVSAVTVKAVQAGN